MTNEVKQEVDVKQSNQAKQVKKSEVVSFILTEKAEGVEFTFQGNVFNETNCAYEVNKKDFEKLQNFFSPKYIKVLK
jgi:hypothetical protein